MTGLLETLPVPQHNATFIIFITVGTERTWRAIEGHWLGQVADQDPIGHQLWPWGALGASWVKKGFLPACRDGQVQS